VFVVMSLIGLLAVLIERPLTVLTVAGLLVGVALVLARRSQSLDGESRRV
jgi:hypothetical protein